ncbi:MAG: AzlC family ABC transporter permease [Hyphomicrobiaceae bacterium]
MVEEASGSEGGDRFAVAPASRRAAFFLGMRRIPVVPATILLSALMGFGALARELGYPIDQAMFVTASVFALPGQVVLIVDLAHGASLLAAAGAVTLTAIRLVPMVVVIAPLFRGSGLARGYDYLASHWVAVTLWVEGLRVLPLMPPFARLPYFLGGSLLLYLLAILATGLGHLVAGNVPDLVEAALLFLTPIYFAISLIAAARGGIGDHAALGLGLVLGPLFYLAAPGFDLLLTGLVGGTLAWAIGRAERRRAS